MRIAVCVKQIPDPTAPYELDPDTNFVARPNDQVLDDTDRVGIEVGLQLAAAAKNNTAVTLISMSPSGSLLGIRQALAMGASSAVIIDDSRLRGADSLLTATVLAAAIKRNGADVVIAGTESTDGYSGVVPQQVAEILKIPSLTFARNVEAIDGGIRIERQTPTGYAVITAPLPVVISVTAGAVEPRYPTFKGIMEARKKTIRMLSCDELGVTVNVFQSITEVHPVPVRTAGEILEDAGQGHLRIIQALEQAKAL